MTNTVLDITKLPEYWEKLAEELEAAARALLEKADNARITAMSLRSEDGDKQRTFPPSRPINRREAAHQRPLGLPPHGAAEPSNEQIEAQARKNFPDALGRLDQFPVG
jgi:hypothetical protein